MKTFKTPVKLLRLLLFSFMFAVCMILGVVPVIPKRKDEYAVEMKIETIEKKETETDKIVKFQADS